MCNNFAFIFLVIGSDPPGEEPSRAASPVVALYLSSWA